MIYSKVYRDVFTGLYYAEDAHYPNEYGMGLTAEEAKTSLKIRINQIWNK